MTVQKPFALPQNAVERCIIHGQGSQYAVELTHRCAARADLYNELVTLLPYLGRNAEMCWFRTLNKESNRTSNCLFDGIKLELNHQSTSSQQNFGICFSRMAFIQERENFQARNTSLPTEFVVIQNGSPRGPPQWPCRGPTDSERLRVNRDGREILFFCQPPSQQQIVTITELRAVISRTLGIGDTTRMVLNAGPFYWDIDFQENGKDVQSTYFLDNIVVEGRHMKTAKGSALIYILERSRAPPALT